MFKKDTGILARDASFAVDAGEKLCTKCSQYFNSNSILVNKGKSSLKTDSEDWFTSSEAALFLGISVQALMNKVSGGKIPFFKFGRRNRYRKSELEELLSQNRKGPTYGYQKRD